MVNLGVRIVLMYLFVYLIVKVMIWGDRFRLRV